MKHKKNAETEAEIARIKAFLQPLVDEQLAQIDEYNAIPHEYSERSMQRIRQILEEQSCHSRRKKQQCWRPVAAACLAVITVLATAISIPPIRAEIIELFIFWEEECIGFYTNRDPSKDYPVRIKEIFLPDIPENWTIEVFSEDKVGGWYHIWGSNDEYISYKQSVVGGNSWYNNEDCVMEEIRLNDRTDAYLLTYGYGDIVIYWIDVYEFSLLGSDVSLEQLLEIAENIEAKVHK